MRQHGLRVCQKPCLLSRTTVSEMALRSRGCQFISGALRRRLHMHGLTQGMSSRSNCYDDAAMESFWATLKTECFTDTIPATRSQAHSVIFDYIEYFYNLVPLDSAQGFQPPVAFKQSLLNNHPNFPRPHFRREFR